MLIMSTYPPAPGGQSGDPYGQPQLGPYVQPEGQTYGNPYGQPYPGPDVQPEVQTYENPYGQPEGGAYGQSYASPRRQSEQPRRSDPYAELGRLDELYTQPEPPHRSNPYAELGRLDEDYVSPLETPNATPAYPTSPYATPEKPRRRRRLIGCLGVVAVLVVGVGGVLTYVGMTTIAKSGQYKLVPPDTFQGLSSDPSNALATSLASSNGDIAKMGATPVLAAYSTHLGDRTPQIVLRGGYGKFLAPGTEVAAAWAGIDQSGGLVKDKADEPGGQLGGTTQCAVTTAGPAELPVCIWADNSTLAMVIFTGQMSRTAIHPDFAALDQRLLALRAVAEVKK